tara:strand:+ start:1853 stop:2965 length:1113 start_codon:yes stop_codon:yes gene_type:complete
MKVPFLKLKKHNLLFKNDFENAFSKFLESGEYVLGKEVEAFESEFSNFIGSEFGIGVSNCLDGLELLLKSINIKPGDEVLVPSNTYIATWLSIINVGAKPIPVEPTLDTFNIDPKNIELAITKRTRAIIVVHLYGLPCQMDEINEIARKNSIYVFEDAAQAHGAKYKNNYAGNLSDGASFSFYPSKNIGALGDAGIVSTNSEIIANKIRLLRNYGSQKKYHNEEIGRNNRLDELQAIFLRIKLKSIIQENKKREVLAKRYIENLSKVDIPIKLPIIRDKYLESSWHLFVILLKKREDLSDFLSSRNIDTMKHYPIPPHKQRAFKGCNLSQLKLPISEEIHANCLSLPISFLHTEDEIDYISETILEYFSY